MKKEMIDEIIAICDKNNVCLGHEDYQGGFIFVHKEGLSEENIKAYHEWLHAAEIE